MLRILFVKVKRNQLFLVTKMVPYSVNEIARYLSKTDPDQFVKNLCV